MVHYLKGHTSYMSPVIIICMTNAIARGLCGQRKVRKLLMIETETVVNLRNSGLKKNDYIMGWLGYQSFRLL